MKKVLSLILTFVMLFTVMVPATATNAEDSSAAVEYEGAPIVIVRGIDFAGLTYEDGSKALAFNAFDLIGIILDAIVGQFVKKDSEAITDGILEYAGALLGPLASDKDGTSLDKSVSMVQYPEALSNYPEFTKDLADSSELAIAKAAIEKVGAENTYFFTYDWRKDPLEVADELNALIETAKADSGMDKVHIACASMGGMITTAYLYKYGSDSAESVTYLSSAHNGTYVCGDSLNGKIHFSADALYSTLMNIIPESDPFVDLMVDLIFAGLKFIGGFDIVCDFLNDFVANNKEKAYGQVLRDIMGTSVGLWALCPDDSLASGIDFIFADCKDEYPVLMEKLDALKDFTYSTEETIDEALANGVKVTFVSNYNKPLVPVNVNSELNGDQVLETTLTSHFAVVADYGKTLSAEQIAAADPAYLSPDNVIDATTAVYRDYTWFVKDAPHVACAYGSDYSEFAFWLVLSEEQPTIHTTEKYPQFMFSDANQNFSHLS